LRTIVAATDFSEHASVALAWATELALQNAALLVLVHAVRANPPTAPEFVQWPDRYRDDIRVTAERRLEREAGAARRRGLTVDCELPFGTAAQAVIAVAEARGADLIVAGTRGRSSWKRALLGSTAARLVRYGRCPVLTVRSPDAGQPRPVRTVVVPTDFSADAALAARVAAGVLAASGPDRRIVLLHAYRIPMEATYLPAHVLSDAIAAADATAKRRIEDSALELRETGIAVETVAREGEPPQLILDQARSVGADLIAMGTHGRSGVDRIAVGSTAERVIASASCPVLTVRCPSS
jgi:nucleotide-binding universal stress UspA family protein